MNESLLICFRLNALEHCSVMYVARLEDVIGSTHPLIYVANQSPAHAHLTIGFFLRHLLKLVQHRQPKRKRFSRPLSTQQYSYDLYNPRRIRLRDNIGTAIEAFRTHFGQKQSLRWSLQKPISNESCPHGNAVEIANRLSIPWARLLSLVVLPSHLQTALARPLKPKVKRIRIRTSA